MENKAAATIEQNLKLLRQLTPDPYWRDSLRSTLIKKPADVKRNSWFLSFHWRLSISLVLLFAFVTGGTAILAQGSVPGDFLYPAKRRAEDFRLVFAGSEDKFVIQQELANRRIAELKRITLARRYQAADPAIKEVKNSISIMSQKASVMSTAYQNLKQEGKDTTPIKETLTELIPTIEQKQTELEQIEDSLPEPARAKVGEIRNSLEDLATQVRNSLEIIEEPKPSTEPEPTPNPDSNQIPVNEGSQNTP